MNILYLSKDYPPHLIGGVGIYVYEISRLLSKMGHKIFIITKTDDTELEYVDAGVRIFRVKEKRIPILNSLRGSIGGMLERLEYGLAVSKKIDELVKQYHIDIIESCEARAEGFWHYLFKGKPPLVIKLHTPETLAFRLDHVVNNLDYRFIKTLEEYWLSKAAKKVGISKEVVDLTAQHFTIRLKDIPLVPNPIDINEFRPNGAETDNTNPEILYVGRLEFRKGVHTLIRAFDHVQQHIPQVRLTFVGADCGMKSYLLEKISKLKFPNKVTFIEQVPRSSLVGYYQRSTICVVPSVWENYPYVCLEAMSCGKTVVASNTGGLARMISHMHNGILFPIGSSKELAEALVMVLKNHSLREVIGRNARRSIEKTHSPEIIAEKTLRIYTQLLN